MNIGFQIKALDKQIFSKYFEMSALELSCIGAYLFKADRNPCYPCRVSLIDAMLDETVLALSYEHLPKSSPYRASGPIFVRENAETVMLEPNIVPQMIRHRELSIRGYDRDDIMIEADLVTGTKLEQVMSRQLKNDAVDYLHLHNAGPGCFNCTVTRI